VGAAGTLFCFPAALFLLLAAQVAAAPARPHAIFFNHSFAVLDEETADAIEHSHYLAKFGVLEMRTTAANGGESWRGRYLSGRQTYLELFGPKDLKDGGPGSTGLAISPDRAGGVAAIRRGLVRQGITHPDTGRRTKQMGTGQVPWFDFVSTPGEPAALSVWAMEYLPGFFADTRAAKEPADYPGDVSRERYQSDAYAERRMRDVSAVEIACPAQDVRPAQALFAAAGLTIRKTRARLEASDGSTTIILDTAPREQAGLRKVVFTLNAPASEAHVERIGRSTLVVGPGEHAVWVFGEP